MFSISRPTFLQTTAAASLLPALPALGTAQGSAPKFEWPENGTLIADEGWHLWVDQHAKWKDDRIYLPEDVEVAKLPVDAPTGGWEVLGKATDAIPVTLPATVEQHFWGKFGSRTKPWAPLCDAGQAGERAAGGWAECRDHRELLAGPRPADWRWDVRNEAW